MNVNYYYSDELTSDNEGNLVQLCRECAKSNADKIALAATGDEDSICEVDGCNAKN